jgi:hypothetical protein
MTVPHLRKKEAHDSPLSLFSGPRCWQLSHWEPPSLAPPRGYAGKSGEGAKMLPN